MTRAALLGLTLIAGAAAHAQGSISGVVREDSTGRPVPSAEVSIDKPKRRVYSDSAGRYALGKLGAGLYKVSVRRLGYLPSATLVRIEKDESREADLSVAPTAAELNAVKVAGASPARAVDFGEFEARRKLGFGVFLDTLTLRQNEHRPLDNLLGTVLGVKVVQPPLCEGLLFCGYVTTRRVAVGGRTATGTCAMAVMLNRAVVSRGGPLAATHRDWSATFDLNAIPVSSLDGVEIYRSTAEIPDRFTGMESECGLVVLWLRQGR